jgi:hypothetical protein
MVNGIPISFHPKIISHNPRNIGALRSIALPFFWIHGVAALLSPINNEVEKARALCHQSAMGKPEETLIETDPHPMRPSHSSELEGRAPARPKYFPQTNQGLAGARPSGRG